MKNITEEIIDACKRNGLKRIINEGIEFEDDLFFRMRDPAWSIMMTLSDIIKSKIRW